MRPATQQAYKAWLESKGGWIQSPDDSFEAGWIAAIAQTEGVRPAGGASTAEDIYAAYPRKVGKQGAIKAIQKAAKIIGPKATSMTRFCPYEILLERTQAFAKATASWPQEERHFICHPATWFNRGSYDDDPKEWERNTAPASQFSVSH
jgi:hypothetical protein